MPEVQAAWIAAVLIQVAADLRQQFTSMPEPTERHIGVAD